MTDKNRKYSFKKHDAERLIEEIHSSLNDDDLILVHGGGSFGHPGAEEYKLNTERPSSVAEGTAKVQLDMRRMNNHLLQFLISEGINAVSVPGGLVTTFEDGELKEFDLDKFENYLSIGTTPVSFGDVAYDEKRGATICSGDDLMVELSSLADKAIFVSDVDGVFKEGKVVKEFIQDMYPLEPEDLGEDEQFIDVTGGMNRKVAKMLEISRKCETFLVNGKAKGRLSKLLKGEETVYTEVKHDK